jgi:hypothetical protein
MVKGRIGMNFKQLGFGLVAIDRFLAHTTVTLLNSTGLKLGLNLKSNRYFDRVILLKCRSYINLLK